MSAMTSSGGSRPTLAFLQSKFLTFEIKKRIVVVGRAQDCDILLEDKSVAEHQCEITIVNAVRATLRDLGSRNGTFVADRCLRSAEFAIHSGDILRFGNNTQSFLFTISGNLPLDGENEELPGPRRGPDHGLRKPLRETDFPNSTSPRAGHLFSSRSPHPAVDMRRRETKPPVRGGNNNNNNVLAHSQGAWAQETGHHNPHQQPHQQRTPQPCPGSPSFQELEKQRMELMQQLLQNQRSVSDWQDMQTSHALRQINLTLASMGVAQAAQAAAQVATASASASAAQSRGARTSPTAGPQPLQQRATPQNQRPRGAAPQHVFQQQPQPLPRGHPVVAGNFPPPSINTHRSSTPARPESRPSPQRQQQNAWVQDPWTAPRQQPSSSFFIASNGPRITSSGMPHFVQAAASPMAQPSPQDLLSNIGRLLRARRVYDLSSAWVRWTALVGAEPFMVATDGVAKTSPRSIEPRAPRFAGIVGRARSVSRAAAAFGRGREQRRQNGEALDDLPSQDEHFHPSPAVSRAAKAFRARGAGGSSVGTSESSTSMPTHSPSNNMQLGSPRMARVAGNANAVHRAAYAFARGRRQHNDTGVGDDEAEHPQLDLHNDDDARSPRMAGVASHAKAVNQAVSKFKRSMLNGAAHQDVSGVAESADKDDAPQQVGVPRLAGIVDQARASRKAALAFRRRRSPALALSASKEPADVGNEAGVSRMAGVARNAQTVQRAASAFARGLHRPVAGVENNSPLEMMDDDEEELVQDHIAAQVGIPRMAGVVRQAHAVSKAAASLFGRGLGRTTSRSGPVDAVTSDAPTGKAEEEAAAAAAATPFQRWYSVLDRLAETRGAKGDEADDAETGMPSQSNKTQERGDPAHAASNDPMIAVVNDAPRSGSHHPGSDVEHNEPASINEVLREVATSVAENGVDGKDASSSSDETEQKRQSLEIEGLAQLLQNTEDLYTTRLELLESKRQLDLAHNMLQQARRTILSTLLRAKQRAIMSNVFVHLRRVAEEGRMAAHAEKIRALGVAAKQTVALHVWRRTSSEAGTPPTLDIILAAWRAEVVRQKRDRRLVASAAKIMQRQNRGKIFTAWYSIVQVRKRERRLIDQMTIRRNHRLAVATLRAWGGVASEQKRQTGLLKDVVQEFGRESPQARTFKLWKGSAHKKGALRASIERLLLRPKAILRSYIARWRRAAVEIGAAQRLVHALSLHWQRNTKQAFHVWAWASKSAAAQEDAAYSSVFAHRIGQLVSCLSSMVLRAKAAAFHQWSRKTLWKDAQVSQLVALTKLDNVVAVGNAQRLQQKLQRALLLWRVATKDSRNHRQSVLVGVVWHSLVRRADGLKAQAWMRWRSEVLASTLAHTHRSIDTLLDARQGLEEQLGESVMQNRQLQAELSTTRDQLMRLQQEFEEVSRFGSQAQELAVQHLRQHNEVVRTKMDVLSRKNEAFRNEIFRLRRTFGAE